MIDREKVKNALERCLICDISVVAPEEAQKAYRECEYTVGLYCGQKRLLQDAHDLLEEQQQEIWELQDQVEYLTDKQKEQGTKLICNLLGGQPYEVYCSKCRTILCILGKGETMNDAKSIFSYCPHCGRKAK